VKEGFYEKEMLNSEALEAIEERIIFPEE